MGTNSENETGSTEVDEENVNDEIEDKSENDQSDGEDSEDDGSEDEGSDRSDDNVDEDDHMEDSDASSDDAKLKKKADWPKAGHDINENKTVFIRNISFDSDQDDLKDMIEQNFGKVLFARLVIDKVTEHPKGTAFVKFSTEESAKKCIDASQSKEGLFLDGRQIYAIAALQKEDAE